VPRIRTTKASPEPANREQWTVGEIARLTKCTLRTIRFYEQQGLLSVTQRTDGRHRRYSSHELARLRSIIELRRADLSLDEIRSIFAIKRRHATGAAAARDLQKLLETKILAIQERLTELAHTKDELEQLHRAILVCADCHGGQKFPAACAECEKFPVVASDTSLLRALWSDCP
jgi:DNA-binding transcriptional MerR regulator